MEDRERVAIGTVVMRNTQYLTAVRPLDGVLAMSTMRFADEVVPRSDVDGLPRRQKKPEAKAMKMANMLVDSLASDWDPERYHDTYTDELRKRIKAKGSGKKVAEEETSEPKAEVLDLMAALERSVQSTRAKKQSAKKSTAKSTGKSAGKATGKSSAARSAAKKKPARARKSA
jgi:DNA end-binding protein Ku